MTTAHPEVVSAVSGARVPFLDLGAASRELAAELTAATSRVIDSGWYVLGPEVERFEAAWAAYVGTRYCVGVACGLDALHLVLLAHGVGPGDEVIVPANTYIATWLAVSWTGATPVPVEPDERTWNIDPSRLAAAITPRSRGIVPVHLYGQCAEMAAINEVARTHGLFVLEDGAQAHGASLLGVPAGGFGNPAAWSFYPSKNLGALGDAGAITTDDRSLAEQLRRLRNYGTSSKYRNEVVGVNSRLDELQAAILSAKLDHLDEWNERRRRVAATYLAELPFEQLGLPLVPEGSDPAWHLFVARAADRDGLRARLAAAGVETSVHYPVPPYRQPAYAGHPAAAGGAGAFPVTDRLHREVVSLPMGPHLTPADAARVVAAVHEALPPSGGRAPGGVAHR